MKYSQVISKKNKIVIIDVKCWSRGSGTLMNVEQLKSELLTIDLSLNYYNYLKVYYITNYNKYFTTY